MYRYNNFAVVMRFHFCCVFVTIEHDGPSSKRCAKRVSKPQKYYDEVFVFPYFSIFVLLLLLARRLENARAYTHKYYARFFGRPVRSED